MKLLLLAVLGLLGHGSAYQVGKEYVFDYYSQVGMGIPQIRDQVAGTGVRGKLHVQVISEYKVMAKLADPEIGEYHGDAPIGQPLPINWRPASGVAKMLEEPFEINVQTDPLGNMMVVNKNEHTFVTNVKKAMTHLFLMKPISQTTDSIASLINHLIEVGSQTPYFTLHGETLFGRCEVGYTLYPIKNITKGPSDPIITVEWILRKTINFGKCSNDVLLQLNGVSNTTNAGRGGLRSIQERSSVSDYHIVQEGPNYKIKWGISEGSTVLNPFGYLTEKLMTLANQTMSFVSEEDIGTVFKVPTPTRISKSWQMEFVSPHRTGPLSPPFVKFQRMSERFPPMIVESSSTGIDIDSTHITTFENDIKAALGEVAQTLMDFPSTGSVDPKITPFDTRESIVPFYMDTVGRLVNALPLKNLEQLYDWLKGQTDEKGVIMFELFLDACAAGGGGAPLELLMQRLPTEWENQPTRANTLFMTLTNNIASPEVLPSIVKFAKNLMDENRDDPKHFFFTTTVWINLASAIHRLCLDKQSWRYAVPYQVFGDVNCSPVKGIQLVLPYLEQQLQQATTDQRRMAIAQAISNLGTGKSFDVLKDIVDGRYGESTLLRSIALYGFMHVKMTDVPRHKIEMVLEPMIMNVKEHTELRQIAVVVSLTWRPSQAWWNSLASFTWKEPSQQMGSFIYSTIYSYSKAYLPSLLLQSRYAEHALRLAKPYPLMYQVTSNRFRADYLARDHMGTFFDVALISSSNSILPAEFFSYLSTSFGGFSFSIFEVAISTRNMDSLANYYLEKLQQFHAQSGSSPSKHPKDVSGGQYRDVLSLLQKELGMKPMAGGKVEASFYHKIYENIQTYIPLTDKVTAHQIMATLKQMVQPTKKKLMVVKYINPVIAEMTMPSQIGFPLITRLTTPTIISNRGEYSIKYDSKGHLSFTVRVDNNFKYISKVITSVRVLVPWEEKLISAGVENMQNLNFPYKMELKYQQFPNYTANVTLFMEANYDKEFPIVHKHNVPFTVTKRMWPGDDIKNIAVKPITVLGGNTLVSQRSIKVPMLYTGLEGWLHYRGDVRYPYTFGNWVDLCRNPAETMKRLASPTAKAYQFSVNLNMGSSETSRFNASMAYSMRLPGQSKQIEGRGWLMKSTILLSGKENRYYETFLKQHVLPESPKVKTHTFASIYRSALPNGKADFSKPANYCLSSDVTEKYIYDIVTLKEALNSGSIERTLKGQLLGDKTCTKNIATVEGKTVVSQRRINVLKQEFSKPYIVNGQASINMAVEPVYDTTEMKISYVDDAPSVVYNASYHMYDFMRGMAFPHAYFNYLKVSNAKDQISVKGERGMGQKYWSMRVQLPKENINLDKVPVPYMLEKILHTRFYPRPPMTNNMIPVSSIFPQCRITPEKVKTFDGIAFDHKQTPCFVVSSVNLKYPDDPIVMTRKDSSGAMETVLNIPKSKVSLLITSQTLKVNGQVFPLTGNPKAIESDGIPVAYALKTSNSVVVEIPFKLVVVGYPKSAEVLPMFAMQKGSQGGICGAHSGNSMYQFLGPHHHYYNDTQLLSSAWTLTEGQGCPVVQVQAQRGSVQQYQKESEQARKNFQSLRTLPKPKQIPDDGILFVYLIRRNGPTELCISMDMVSICKPGFVKTMDSYRNEVFGCFIRQQIPEELIKNEKKGYITHQLDLPPEVETSFYVDHVRGCRKV